MQPDHHNPEKLQHRTEIQGLRALAVLSVLIYHANAKWFPGGFIGVDIFFVISGFLMTKILVSSQRSPISLLINFYLARARRIIPAYLTVLSITTIATGIFFIPNDFRSYQDSLEEALIFLSNQYFADYYDYFGPAAHELPLLHTWSLAIEIQFYLIYPFIVILAPRHYLLKFIILAIAALIAHIVLQYTTDRFEAAYFQLSNRMPEFLIGAAAALTKCNLSKLTSTITASFGALLLLTSFASVSGEAFFNQLQVLPVCIGTALLLITRETIFHSITGNKIFHHLGNISYSLYLWHWPVLALMRYYLQEYQVPSVGLLCAATIIWVLSEISYRFVEKKTWRFNRRALSRELKLWGSCGLLLTMSALFASYINKKLDVSLSTELTRYADNTQICHGHIVGLCERGDLLSATTILIMGDSHAAQLNIFADRLGRDLSVKFLVISSSSCIPITTFDIDRIPESARDACRTQTLEIKNSIPHVDGVILAGKWTYHTTSQAFMNGLSAFIRGLEQSRTPLAIMAQPPHLSHDITRLRRIEALGLSAQMDTVPQWQHANSAVRDLSDWFTYIDTTNLPLFANVPFYGSDLIYMDSHHLNERGADLYGRQATSSISEWLSFVETDH